MSHRPRSGGGAVGVPGTGYFGSGASAVFVKKNQMTCAALGVLPWGHGKPWLPAFHIANPTRAPLEQSAHVVSVIAPCGVAADDPLHPSTARSAARRDWPKTEFSAELESCVVEGSADRLRVAVRNLLDNAAKFGPPEGPVHVRLAAGSLTVRDHGPGISPDDAPHVFDRFYRSLSARAVPGSGLGLAVVREIAHGHSGSVAAENAPGGGAVMRLTLPAG